MFLRVPIIFILKTRFKYFLFFEHFLLPSGQIFLLHLRIFSFIFDIFVDLSTKFLLSFFNVFCCFSFKKTRFNVF